MTQAEIHEFDSEVDATETDSCRTISQYNNLSVAFQCLI
jgi:hypothetical protein